MKYLKFFLILSVFFVFVSCVSINGKNGMSRTRENMNGKNLHGENNASENNVGENATAGEIVVPSVYIAAVPTKNANQLVKFFISKNPNVNLEKIKLMANLYVQACKVENINSDVAFVQMCLETGFLCFGGLVSEDMNNFCGLGAIDENNRGNSFSTVKDGIIAHVQHLKAYGSAEPLNGPLIDPRYKWVNPKGKAPTIFELAGAWASDKEYGNKLFNLLLQLAEF